MTKARKHQTPLDATPHYHVISRCVRGAFLCSQSQFTGRCMEHRRKWIENALELLSDVCFKNTAKNTRIRPLNIYVYYV